MNIRNLYYHVKIEAAKMLLENTDNTFVTPVFNGSTSLRDAAGQMIENAAKAARRKQTVDEEFMTKLFSDMTSLYHLDSIERTSGGSGKELGPLPTPAKVFLIILFSAWIGIIAVNLADFTKKRIKKR